MSMDTTGITIINEYYTNHYFSSIFEENVAETISSWRARAKDEDNYRTPWSLLRESGKQFYPIINRFKNNRNSLQTLQDIRSMADSYLKALDYPEAAEFSITVEETEIPVYLEMAKSNGAPLLWVLLAHSVDEDGTVMNSKVFSTKTIDTDLALYSDVFINIQIEDLISKLLFGITESPRFLMVITMNQIALIDREKWNNKRYLQFELEDIFSRREETTLQAMSVLLHKESICPDDGKILLDTLSENSQRHASGVSQDLKYALRESIELLGNEVLYDLQTRFGKQPEEVDAGKLTLECLRYMYRMLFVLFIEARPELGFAPIKEQTYFTGYSLESLRDIANDIRDDVDEVGNGYYLHETLSMLYELIYTGYPQDSSLYNKAMNLESIHDLFVIPPLKAHIFDPEFTPTLTKAKLRNKVMLRIVDLMSLTRPTGKKGGRGRISYANLGINQMGAVYEALLSYRGFIAKEDLYEVKAKGDKVDDLDVGYFVPERELDQYDADERVRTDDGKLRIHKKGEFIYRLAGREREKSASYYTPECLTQCLVKYALKELLKDKSADEILNLTVCEPAMGSAAFLNEAINQLAEAYLEKKQKELGTTVEAEKRPKELQKIKMFIADNNVYGIDLNPVAVELAEVSLWLNTIYEGGYVPWFGEQLVNGNSLIGARRQGYSAADLTATAKNLRWYEKAPERIPFERSAAQKKRIYHFLVGDPGMCNYTDKVIKCLAPDQLKTMKEWNKEFTKPYTEDELNSLRELCGYVDNLWKKQITARRELNKFTSESVAIWGHEDESWEHIPKTIREKDEYLLQNYKTQSQLNAGAYARLKFAMDYWCSLWFWPIDKADELPTRWEFLQDMNYILHGVIITEGERYVQKTLWDDDTPDEEGVTMKSTSVNIAQLCEMFPRLAIARRIADENKFMHWELEFADVFADNGGFDLVIGNPPWNPLEWKEAGVISDYFPIVAVQKWDATRIANENINIINKYQIVKEYCDEYIEITGQQNYYRSSQNYSYLCGALNLYKCFLPQSWYFTSTNRISAFIHQDGVFDDPKGVLLREQIYPRLRYHFQFENELNLFEGTNDHGRLRFSLNVYNNHPSDSFDSISNVFFPSTIDECYNDSNEGEVPGIKDKNGNWNTKGHRDRLLHIGEKELKVFANLFDGSDEWKSARLPLLHAKEFADALSNFVENKIKIQDINEYIYTSEMWNETASKKKGILRIDVGFPKEYIDMIYSGSHMSVANPFFKTARRICVGNSDFDCIDLTQINDSYIQRSKFKIDCSMDKYNNLSPITPWDEKYYDSNRILMRKMLNQSGERTLVPIIASPKVGHIHGVFGMSMNKFFPVFAATMFSIPFDFFIKTTGKTNIDYSIISHFPVLSGMKTDIALQLRGLMLNCLCRNYSSCWKQFYNDEFLKEGWSKSDPRLDNKRFSTLTSEWTWDTPLRTDYERRQALVEIDVLTAMALGMTLEQLKTIYRIQFPVLQQYEADTWYDANGRIVFTTNRSLVGVGFDRKEWEGNVKGAMDGMVFTRTIEDDTMPGGPVTRTIEYVAPFDKCDREQDYETAWKFFEEKYRSI